MRVIDEPTAAAIGYGVKAPNALVLVFDFGGGTLDVSLVRLPDITRKVGVLVKLGRLLGMAKDKGNQIAQPMGKAYEVLGGEDIDTWIKDDVLSRLGVKPSEVAGIERMLKTVAEGVKIKLSSEDRTPFYCFDPDKGRTLSYEYKRSELEGLLDRKRFFAKIQKCLESVIGQAKLRGKEKRDIDYVVMTGGASLMPSVKRAVQQNFPDMEIQTYMPFEAVAHGALYLGAGVEVVKDFILHSYGIKGWNSQARTHAGKILFWANQGYPAQNPKEQVYSCASDGQGFIDLEIGEIDHGERLLEVIEMGGKYQVDGHLPDSWDALVPVERFINMVGSKTLRLDPPGRKWEKRIRCSFRIDEKRKLRATVVDIRAGKTLLNDSVLADLQ